VSRSRSFARQLQAIVNNLVVPRGNEVVGTNGIAVAVYTMNRILLLVMWALVVAIPCQERGLQVLFFYFLFLGIFHGHCWWCCCSRGFWSCHGKGSGEMLVGY